MQLRTQSRTSLLVTMIALAVPLVATPAWGSLPPPSLESAAGSGSLRWTKQDPAEHPGGELYAGAPMVFDAERRETLLYAVPRGAGPAETWTWDGETWNQLDVATPSRRSGAVMVYDEARSRAVLFGGFVDDTAVDETWVFEDGAWRLLEPAVSPPGRYNAAAAYDPDRAEIVVYGGNHLGTHLTDTWTFDGAVWREQHPARHPRSRWGAGLTFDTGRSELVLFGGLRYSEGGNDYPRQTWTWDGLEWTRLSVDKRPPGRTYFAMATVDGRPTIFGGSWSATGDRRDTWVLGDEGWRRAADGPRVRVPAPYLAADPVRGEAVLFARVGVGHRQSPETWTLSP